ncbi:MAG: DUF4412 domain-containing protein, partial [Steroidobacteraceae bacterium]|nr:DUF4412 domain-containing protein [Steroidobacteraceae bacterium]MDW8260365.1 hypothetical protein [Gammaproteobacteria bacterium]
RLQDELCIVPFTVIPSGADVQLAYRDFAAFFDQVRAASGPGPWTGIFEYSEIVRTGGFPVRMRSYHKGQLQPEYQFVKVYEAQNVPASMFEPPPGYRRVPFAGQRAAGDR